MFENVGNLFRTAANSQPATASGVPVTSAPNPMAAPQNPAADPAKVPASGTSANPPAGTSGAAEANPLDAFKDLFTITENDVKNQPQDPFASPLLTFDPKKFAEAAGKMNFAAAINPELAQKALGGDVNAFMDVINSATRSVFASATQMFTGVMEQAFKKNNGRFDQSLGSKFRDFQLTSQSPTNPAFKHPALAPMLAGVRASISAKYPNLSANEVAQKAEEFFNVMGSVMGGATGASKTDQTPADVDWEQFLTLPSTR